MLLEYVKDMPKVGTSFQLDLSSLLSVLFFTWIIELLFPVSMMRCIDVAFCKQGEKQRINMLTVSISRACNLTIFFLGYVDISGV